MDQLIGKMDDIIRLLEQVVDNTSMEVEIVDHIHPDDIVIDMPNIPAQSDSSNGESIGDERVEREREREERTELNNTREDGIFHLNELRLGNKWRIISEFSQTSQRDILKFQWFNGFLWETQGKFVGGSLDRQEERER